MPPVRGSIAALDMPASRKGRTASGYAYTIYPDGSASIDTNPAEILSGWSIDCGTDAMNDRRKCSVTSHKARLLIFYGFSANPQSVCIVGHDFPGRRGAIRVDSNSPINTDTDGCVPAGAAIKQLASGSSVTTRRVEWPYDYGRDETASIAGAKEVMELITHIQSNIDNMRF